MNTSGIRPIRTDGDYEAAHGRVREVFHAPADRPEADKLEILTILVHEYERAMSAGNDWLLPTDRGPASS